MPDDIIGLTLRLGMALAAINILVGVVGAAVLSRVMASMLFAVGTTDVLTFGRVPIVLALVAFAATLIPAWRTR